MTDFITVPAAAQQSGLSEKYIRKLCHAGTLRASCIQEARGPIWQIERASWDAFLAARDGWLGDVARALAGKAHAAAEITTAIRRALDGHGLEVRRTIRKPKGK